MWLSDLVRDFGDPAAEAWACRTGAALFDFSFMSRARVSGPGAAMALARLQPRTMHDLAPGRIRYALAVAPDGVVEADLTVWRLAEDSFELMSGRRQDIERLAEAVPAGTTCQDLSDDTRVYAVQGPDSLRALSAHADGEALRALPFFGHARVTVAGAPCRVGRLGYTGERGFEIVASRARGSALWKALAEVARPAGFAAADRLRIEAGFILFLNECLVRPTAAELGLERFSARSGTPPRMRLACFRATVKPPFTPWHPAPPLGMPRPGTIVVTSACRREDAGDTLGLGYVVPDEASPGRRVTDAGGLFSRVSLMSIPVHDPEKRRPRGAW